MSTTPDREHYGAGGMREPAGDRPRLELITPLTVPYDDQLLTRWGRHMAAGAVKYADRNWELFADPVALERCRSSAFRHFLQWHCGQTDEDHAAALLFNVQAVDYIRGRLDGRWPGPDLGELTS